MAAIKVDEDTARDIALAAAIKVAADIEARTGGEVLLQPYPEVQAVAEAIFDRLAELNAVEHDM